MRKFCFDDIHKNFQTCKKLAYEEEFKFRRKFSAILVYKNEIVSVGSNIQKTHPFALKYGRNEDSTYWHAETNCIFNAYKKGLTRKQFRNSILYIYRWKLENDRGRKYFVSGISRPCEGCMNCIKTFEIPYVVHSVDYFENDFTVCDIKETISA